MNPDYEHYNLADIEEVENIYYAEEEYNRMMNAYHVVLENINYYSTDECKELLLKGIECLISKGNK